MAPEIALDECNKLRKGSTILDPMCGSGTTLRMAIESNLNAIGSDLDPLAVLVTGVNTTPLNEELAVKTAADVVRKAKLMSERDTDLPWIDSDKETHDFINFWFAQKQIDELRKLMTVINNNYGGALQAFLKVTASRLIITKQQAASLAMDTSHSRPHRVATGNDYDIFINFVKYAKQIAQRLPRQGVNDAMVRRADARNLSHIKNNSIDAVITSPPYLNAIDYMRGHKLSLVWLGYKLSDLREVRSTSIGAERKPNFSNNQKQLQLITKGMSFYEELQSREKGMFDRYILDILALMEEIARVLKSRGKATLVVGNSCLRGVFIKNTMAVIGAANLAGLEFLVEDIRDLPANMRYLPINAAKGTRSSSLTKRMRTESILSFAKTAA